MAVMHKKTWELYHNDQNIVPAGYVEIDEWIAPVIQVLNQKGYATRFCCSGHPMKNWLIINRSAEEGYEKVGAPCRSYIMFRAGITLPSLPPGFRAKQNTYASTPRLMIEKEYDMDTMADDPFYMASQSILESMKQLYHWALDLPDFETGGIEQD